MEIGHRDKSVLEIRQNGIKLKRIKPNQLTWNKIEGNETKQNKSYRIHPKCVLFGGNLHICCNKSWNIKLVSISMDRDKIHVIAILCPWNLGFIGRKKN